MDVSATTSKEQENEPEKPSTNLPCGVSKCQAIRICICKLSDRHNEQVDKHISTPEEGNQAPSVHYLEWRCNVCDSAFDRKFDLEKHILSNHVSERKSKEKSSTIVISAFDRKFDLEKHLLSN